jgi:hypothetical protein
MRGFVITLELIFHHTVTLRCMYTWISASVAKRQLSLEPFRLCNEVSLVFRDKLIDAQCPLYLSGERTHRGEWEIDRVDSYGVFTSPPHLFFQHFHLLKVRDFEVPPFSEPFCRLEFNDLGFWI